MIRWSDITGLGAGPYTDAYMQWLAGKGAEVRPGESQQRLPFSSSGAPARVDEGDPRTTYGYPTQVRTGQHTEERHSSSGAAYTVVVPEYKTEYHLYPGQTEKQSNYDFFKGQTGAQTKSREGLDPAEVAGKWDGGALDAAGSAIYTGVVSPFWAPAKAAYKRDASELWESPYWQILYKAVTAPIDLISTTYKAITRTTLPSSLPSVTTPTYTQRVQSQQEKNLQAERARQASAKAAEQARVRAAEQARVRAAEQARVKAAEQAAEQKRQAEAAAIAKLNAEFESATGTLPDIPTWKTVLKPKNQQAQQARQYSPAAQALIAEDRQVQDAYRRDQIRWATSLRGLGSHKSYTPTWQDLLAQSHRVAIPYEDPFTYTPKTYPAGTYSKPISDPFTYTPKHYPTTVKAAHASAPAKVMPQKMVLTSPPVQPKPRYKWELPPQTQDATGFFPTVYSPPALPITPVTTLSVPQAAAATAASVPNSFIIKALQNRQYYQAEGLANALPEPQKSQWLKIIQDERAAAISADPKRKPVYSNLMGYWSIPNFAALVSRVLAADRARQPIPDAPELQAKFVDPTVYRQIPDAPELQAKFVDPTTSYRHPNVYRAPYKAPSVTMSYTPKAPTTYSTPYKAPTLTAAYRPKHSYDWTLQGLAGIAEDLQGNPWVLVKGLLLIGAAYMVWNET